MSVFYSLVSKEVRALCGWVDFSPFFVGGAAMFPAWYSDFSVINTGGVAEIAGADISLN